MLPTRASIRSMWRRWIFKWYEHLALETQANWTVQSSRKCLVLIIDQVIVFSGIRFAWVLVARDWRRWIVIDPWLEFDFFCSVDILNFALERKGQPFDLLCYCNFLFLLDFILSGVASTVLHSLIIGVSVCPTHGPTGMTDCAKERSWTWGFLAKTVVLNASWAQEDFQFEVLMPNLLCLIPNHAQEGLQRLGVLSQDRCWLRVRKELRQEETPESSSAYAKNA